MDIRALTRFMADRSIALGGELHAEPISGGRSNLTCAVTDGHTTWIVRRPPLAGRTPSAHDMVREYTVTKALYDTTIPVPRTIAIDKEGTVLGAPCTVTEFVTGQVLRDQNELAALGDDQVQRCARSLVQLLARLHALDYRALGLTDFGRPQGYVSRQVRRWARQWDEVHTRELPDAARLAAALSDFDPPPSEAIVHGDFRIDNTILDDDDPAVVRAVVDWELSTIGDPLTDIALMCAYRSPTFDLVLGTSAAWTSPRLPSPDELAQQYCLASGRDLPHWNRYLALANFKLGVISEGIAYRAGKSADTTENLQASHATPEFMAAGLQALHLR
ncbi:phosphotransferase family protein [Nocardia bovistercoris]|uniref:Phosphotransferase family protein n=1 Tax=Nocardia bovistercoris TaxID=2785916 RepID=A0A931IK68_9NOCA|nr:phosphotransferase family protein [Nocardia bovistercoris]MBH0781053.1 phosphotransferase family protein [Nocardia bovistercoris]